MGTTPAVLATGVLTSFSRTIAPQCAPWSMDQRATAAVGAVTGSALNVGVWLATSKKKSVELAATCLVRSAKPTTRVLWGTTQQIAALCAPVTLRGGCAAVTAHATRSLGCVYAMRPMVAMSVV